MACSHISASTVGYATQANLTLTAPASIADGDNLEIFFHSFDATAITPPTGFTLKTNLLSPDGVRPQRQRVYYKRASSESGNYAFTHASAECEAYMQVVRGAVAAGDPFTDPAPVESTDNTDPVDITGGTPATSGNMVTVSVVAWDAYTAHTGEPSGTTPTFTERYDGTTLFAANGVLSPAGATGTKTITAAPNAGGIQYHLSVMAFTQAATASDTLMAQICL